MSNWVAWLSGPYHELPQTTLDFYHNLHLVNFATNKDAPEPYWNTWPAVQKPAMCYNDLTFAQGSWPPPTSSSPSLIENDPGYLPETSASWLPVIGIPLHSYVLESSSTPLEQLRPALRPQRSYWTGKPARRRNLPAG